jgi:LacI family transcriptional regulator, repressor for deo operon, udp, cdd, tsx, nupC, and nupG
MSTRREVAEAAGVSLRTVSNVVSGFDRVAPETRQRVLEAIEQLGYRPSEVARTLKAGRSGLIGLVVHAVDNPYFAELTRALVEEGALRGLTVVIDQTDGDLERERGIVERAARGGLFDALVLNPLALAPSDLEALPGLGPVIILGENPFPGFDKVMIDNFAAARDAVRHLLAGGRERIAFVGANRTGNGTSVQRLDGYLAALDEAGIARDDALIPDVPVFTRQAGAAALSELMSLPRPPDAVFAINDPLALGVLRAAHQHGVRVPEQLAIVGFDDIEDGRFSTPSLTTISPDKRWIARTALDRIVRRLDGETLDVQTVLAPYRLIARESSA